MVYILDNMVAKCDSFEEALAIRKQKEKELFGDFQWNPNAEKVIENDYENNEVCSLF